MNKEKNLSVKPHKIDDKEKRHVSTMMKNKKSSFFQPNLTNDTLK